MTYKGYTGTLEVDEDAGLLHGRVEGLRDVVTFEGRTVAEAAAAFRDSVDDYLEYCAELGREPEKPYSGRFVVRIEPSLHATLAAQAAAEGLSLNAKVAAALETAAGRRVSKGRSAKTNGKSRRGERAG